MNFLKNAFTIHKKELRSYFDSPTAYIVVIVFLLVWQFLFFRDVFLVGEASFRILLNYLPWLFLFLIPAITMGSISQEKTQGTLELLLTHPLKELQLLVGKFWGSFVFVLIPLMIFIPLGISFDMFGELDWGIITAQILASAGMALVLTALGIFISTLFSSVVTSLLISVVVMFFLIILDSQFITNSIPFWLGSLLEQLSVASHFDSMARGVIDLRDVWYFLSATTVFLALAYLQLIRRKLECRPAQYWSWKVGTTLFIGIVILTNILGSRIPGRIDLTRDNIYTLSPATEQVAKSIDDLTYFTLYASQELPPTLKPILRDIQDILQDYETLGNGNIIVRQKDPSAEDSIALEARNAGIPEMQFNVIDENEYSIKKGYLGISMTYGDTAESIAFIENTADLEYQLTSFLARAMTTEKKNIVFLTGHGEKDSAQYATLSRELSPQFNIRDFSIVTPSSPEELVGENEASPLAPAPQISPIPADTDVLVIAGPQQQITPEEKESITRYIENGGATLFLLEQVDVNLQTTAPSINPESFSDFIEPFGVSVDRNLIYDIRSHERIRVGGGIISYILPYPFWIRSVPSQENSPITNKITGIVFPWANSLSIDEDQVASQNLIATPLLSTTENGGAATEPFLIDPQQDFSQSDLSQRTIALSLVSKESENAPGQRMIIAADSDFLTDPMIGNSPENMAFGLNAISWLAQETSLANIKLKQRNASPLDTTHEEEVRIQYGNMALAFLIPFIVGIVRLSRRKSLRKKPFAPQ